jgi:beta-carotene 3-hydroxylase
MSITVIIFCGLITIATFFFWEFVAWFTHKFVMHGFLWSWHRSHHSVHNRVLERNDLFGVVFSLPSIAIFYYFSQVVYNPYMIAAALGIFLYGVFYVVFHDIIVHQRIPWKLKRKNYYLRRMVNAHHVHHSRHTKDGCEAFGFLIIPAKYAPGKFDLQKGTKPYNKKT